MTVDTSIRAADLMERSVLTLPVDAPLREAIEAFEENDVTGIPVVDETGAVVGSLTLRDVARHLFDERFELERHYDMTEVPDDSVTAEGEVDEDVILDKEDYSPQALDEKRVKDWMNPAPITVPPDASLKAVCETMTREGIHRVLVVDGEHFGILTSMDVVRYVADRG